MQTQAAVLAAWAELWSLRLVTWPLDLVVEVDATKVSGQRSSVEILLNSVSGMLEGETRRHLCDILKSKA